MSMDKEWMNRVPSPFPAVVVTHLPPDGRTKGASVSQTNNSHRWAAVFLLWRVGPVRWMGTLICICCEIWTLLLLVLEVCLSVCSSYFISLPPPQDEEEEGSETRLILLSSSFLNDSRASSSFHAPNQSAIVELVAHDSIWKSKATFTSLFFFILFILFISLLCCLFFSWRTDKIEESLQVSPFCRRPFMSSIFTVGALR